MKFVSGIIMSLALGSALTIGCSRSDSGNGDSSVSGKVEKSLSNYSLPNSVATEAIDPTGSYIVIAKDLDGGREYLQSGKNRAQAVQRAMELCQLRSGLPPTCAVVRQFDLQTAPTIPNGNSGEATYSSYACIAREFTIPTAATDLYWAGVGKSASDAKSAALKKCTEKGGVQCRIVRCTNADYNKEIIN